MVKSTMTETVPSSGHGVFRYTTKILWLFSYCLESFCRNSSWCWLGSVVEQAHLVSWPSVVRGTCNWTRVVFFCGILGCLLFLICIEFVYLYFPVQFCLSVSVKWLAVKTASEMSYIVSSWALNSTPTNQSSWCVTLAKQHALGNPLQRQNFRVSARDEYGPQNDVYLSSQRHFTHEYWNKILL